MAAVLMLGGAARMVFAQESSPAGLGVLKLQP
jgi:hypothetical protein